MAHRPGWHVARWPALAWLETAVKGAAQVVGIVALARAIGGDIAQPHGMRLAEVVILAVLSLGLLGAIVDRVSEREVIAMAFVIPNNVAHWGVLVALVTSPGPGRLAAIFFALMFTGELIKIAFLRTSGYRVRDLSPTLVVGLTATYAVGYAVAFVFDVVG